jgi:hypothetical protein
MLIGRNYLLPLTPTLSLIEEREVLHTYHKK